MAEALTNWTAETHISVAVVSNNGEIVVLIWMQAQCEHEWCDRFEGSTLTSKTSEIPY